MISLLIACQCIISCQKERTERPPNIILIMADDMGVETLSAYGGTSYQTPHLDAGLSRSAGPVVRRQEARLAHNEARAGN